MKLFDFPRESKSTDPEALNFFRENGFILFGNVLSSEELARVNKKVDEMSAEEMSSGTAHIYGDNLQRIWNLVNKDPLFQELITFPQILHWAETLFERKTQHLKYFLSSFQANILKPGAKAQILHIDTPVPDPLPPWEMKINTIWLLNDFTEENGATEVIPGSHKFGRRPVDSDPKDHQGLIKVIAPAGTMILTSGSLWHRSGDNNSSQSRRVLLGSFAASYFREISSEEDIVRYQETRGKHNIADKCWEIAGGLHGIKPGH